MRAPAQLILKDRFATIVLDDPDRRNVLSYAMFDALDSALDGAAESTVVLIRASGPAFCAGFDLAACIEDSDQLGKLAQRLGALLQRLAHTSSIVVAEVQGPALAGGCALVSACDIVVASNAATFGYPVHRIGVSPAVSLPTLLESADPGAARALALSGEIWNAQRAYACGLVHAVYESALLSEETNKLITRLLTHPAEVLASTKTTFTQLGQSAEENTIQRATTATKSTAQTEEARTMLTSFWSRKAKP